MCLCDNKAKNMEIYTQHNDMKIKNIEQSFSGPYHPTLTIIVWFVFYLISTSKLLIQT